MADFLSILARAPLFMGFDEQTISLILEAQGAQLARYARGEVLLREGERTDKFGIVVDGTIFIEQNDFWGNRNLMGRISAGLIFAESFACSRPQRPLAVNVVADSGCVVYWLDCHRLLKQGSLDEKVWRTLVANLIHVLSNKNIRFNEKVTHMGQRTTRDKLLSYLSMESRKAHSAVFDIPFNRQELADYLGVERSAMSACLGKLRDEGMLTFDKQHFHLLEVE